MSDGFAGQNPPLLFTSSGGTKLETDGTIVGLFLHATYEQEELQLSAGDSIVVFSDDVPEALNPKGEEYGKDRIREALAPHWLEPSDVVLQTLLNSVREFALGAPQSDDVTALVVRNTPSTAHETRS